MKPPLGKNKIKILIAEDDELSNVSLKLLLEDILVQNCEIHSIYTGETVVEEIEKNQYDLVFLDNKLPNKSGLNILKELKRKQNKTNIIFLTGYSDEETAVQAMKLGAKDYISKGILNIVRLEEAINEILLDSSILEISPEVLLKIQHIFNNNEEIMPHQTLSINYRQDERFEKEILTALDILNKYNYVEKTSLFTTVSCPSCDSNPEEFYLTCPICNSYELTKGQVIEHNKCHHIDFKTNFIDAEGRLTCPKCRINLKQIGVDYIKVGINYKCNNSHIFPYPEHRYICNECGNEFNEDESKIITIYKYKLLNEGRIILKICDSIKNPEHIESLNEPIKFWIKPDIIL